LSWEAGRSLQAMCDSAWNFHEKSTCTNDH